MVGDGCPRRRHRGERPAQYTSVSRPGDAGAERCVAVPEADGSLTVWASTQSVFGVQAEVARTLGLDAAQVRVRAPWIGGGFGAKGGVYPEQLIVAGARPPGRPAGPVDRDPEREPARA